MKSPSIQISAILILIASLTHAQSPLTLRANAGYAMQVRSGYYFSFDIGIPICKGLEIAPTLNHASMIPDASIDYTWHSPGDLTSLMEKTPDTDNEYGSTLSSINLLIVFKPFDFIDSDKLKKHELLIATGYGYKSYVTVGSRYNFNQSAYEVTQFGYTSDRGLAPYVGKISYNYSIRDNVSVGLVTGLDISARRDPFLTTGLQLCVKM